ncbi:MAG: prenyltransferase/squalene oxidase repeat-containing protein, partial [Planctomycetota bacterium]
MPPLREPPVLPRCQSRTVVAVALLAITATPFVAGSRGAAQDLDAAAVLGAIDRGVAYLKRQQKPKGNWSDTLGNPGGLSALVTLALLNAGLAPDDPTVDRGLDYLRRLNLDEQRTYFVSLRIMALCAATPGRDRETIRKAVDWLEKTQVKEGRNVGAWSYSDTRLGEGDPSNSQFAVLALHEAERAGVG